jgi:dephospho-CoA kinase
MGLKVALTGGIATGKSYVLNQFRKHGVACLDADEIAHSVMSAGTDATAAIAARFGTTVLGADGSVDRTKLGSIVFADAAARKALEAIVHPDVYQALSAAMRSAELAGEPLVIADIPLLFETGAEDKFDRIIVTTCPIDMQLARLVERGLSEAAARQRLSAQWPADTKISRADFVIRTDGTREDTNRQVDQVLTALKS